MSVPGAVWGYDVTYSTSLDAKPPSLHCVAPVVRIEGYLAIRCATRGDEPEWLQRGLSTAVSHLDAPSGQVGLVSIYSEVWGTVDIGGTVQLEGQLSGGLGHECSLFDW